MTTMAVVSANESTGNYNLGIYAAEVIYHYYINLWVNLLAKI